MISKSEISIKKLKASEQAVSSVSDWGGINDHHSDF